MAAVRVLVIDPPPVSLPPTEGWTRDLPGTARIETSDSVDEARLRLARDGFDLAVVAVAILMALVPFTLLARREHSPSDPIRTGAEQPPG